MVMEVEEAQTLPVKEELTTGYNCESDLQNLTKRVKRLELLTYLIILLVGLSIILPFTRDFASSPVPTSNKEENKALPGNVDTSTLTEKLQEAFNNSDYDTMYSCFGDYAKARISKEQLSQTINRLRPGLGKLNIVRYSDYNYLGNQDNADWYRIRYMGDYDAGPGSVELTVRVYGESWELTGVIFKLGQLQ